jgi:CRP-like cAMP-binding protein
MTTPGLGQFISRFPKSGFRRNSLIADGSEVQNHIYYLESGLVKQYCVSQSGADFMTHLFRPGSFFPPTVLSGSDLSSCYFEAFTSVVVRVIPVDVFVNYLRSDKELLLDFVTLLSRYFGTLTRRINQLAGSSAYQRTAAALVYLGERLGNSDDNHDQVFIDAVVTHKELAAWSGTARETASINMKALEKKGLIEYKKRKILITSWSRLLHESGQ